MTDLPVFDARRPIALIGMGVMGSKVAWACARAGLQVRAFDIDRAQLAASIELALTWSTGAERERVRAHLIATTDLQQATQGVQLAFENVPESESVKRDALQALDRCCAPDVPIGSNTSSMLASELAAYTRRPERVFAMNFNDPRTDRLVELMGHEGSVPDVLAFAEAWARHIGMVPVRVRREQMGYAMNRLWRVIKREALRQADAGITTPEELDRAWMLAFGMRAGPFGIMDEVGLKTVLMIEERYARASGDPADAPPAFLREMVAQGRTGARAGAGFYSHPEPAYKQLGFLDRQAAPAHDATASKPG